ncbi:hypothetical protein B0A75_06380 [Flavobacterium oncorhynchi]|uniref:Uncharacterized protein n=1 Tax=Flavobacterium oncorhynchi TaxID=728056 RepID=A0A226I631_9FLAO|nr:hypothetical protein [Flavobacterium oncorhynchi]OXB01192.1 hypothetical protein B0A75_06380 [Flavobacterium oncorhynchi]
MLNKGLRDEESIRIENTLRTLHALIFVPKFWNAEDTSLIDEQLKSFGLSLQRTIEIPEEELIILLQQCHLDWNQQEQFADILMGLSAEKQFNFREKALAIYQYIQQESKVFSFGINAKIASAKNR